MNNQKTEYTIKVTNLVTGQWHLSSNRWNTWGEANSVATDLELKHTGWSYEVVSVTAKDK